MMGLDVIVLVMMGLEVIVLDIMWLEIIFKFDRVRNHRVRSDHVRNDIKPLLTPKKHYFKTIIVN